jgi:ABC-type multidrug transport system fused ATPase/permease subunit
MNELLFLSGLAGLLVGLYVSHRAREEVIQGNKYFSWVKDGSFMLASGLFLYAYGIVMLVVVLLVLSILIRVASQRVKRLVIAITIPFMIFFNLSNPTLISPLAAIYVIIGLLEGGIASSERYARKKKNYSQASIMASQATFIIIPLILLVIALVTT